MGELQCPTLDYVYSMSWAEFQIRAFSYNRIEEKKDLRAREIAWSSLIGSHYNPKKLPKTKEKFWQIGEKKVSINTSMQDKIKAAQEKYFKEKQQVNGVR